MSVEDFHDSRDDLRRPGFQRRQRQEPKGRRPDTLQIGGNRTQNGREVGPGEGSSGGRAHHNRGDVRRELPKKQSLAMPGGPWGRHGWHGLLTDRERRRPWAPWAFLESLTLADGA